MRLALAVVFFFAVLFGALAIIGSQGWLDGSVCDTPWWKDLLIGVGTLVFLATLTCFTLWAFNRRPLPHSRDGDFEQLRVLAGKGDVVMQDFKARRAFQVAEYEDEGLHYFVELDDGRTLYLTGQGLYYYEPLAAEDDEDARPRSFPNADFTVFRDNRGNYKYLLDIECRGAVLEPEVTAPEFEKEYFDGDPWQDGEIISDRSYDELKQQRLAAADKPKR
jgi:hypothetical protein